MSTRDMKPTAITDVNGEDTTVRTWRDNIVIQTGDLNGRPAYHTVDQATALIAQLQAAILAAAEYNG